MRKLSILLVMIIISVLSLFSCGGGEDDKDYVKVMVTTDSGATVTSENPIDVEVGTDCEFDIQLGTTFVFVSASAGEYDVDTGKLTLKNVTERMNVTFTTEDVGYDTTGKTLYIFEGEEGDKSDVKSMAKVHFGTSITVEAANTSRIFAGWSFGKTIARGGEVASTDRKYTFRAHPDMVSNEAVRIFANYVDTNVFYYDTNGGSVNLGSENMRRSEYYTADLSGSKLKITLSSKYYEFSECASLFWSDGTFVRDGYILKEYNTKPDGTGESYSLGSKFYTVENNDHATVYCIWEQISEGFEYADFTFARPSGITEAYSPEWNEEGVIITKYNGDAEKVTVPEKIGGKPVIAIASDAFVSKSMKTLILPRHLLSVADGAVRSCTQLTTIYFPDGIYSITDNALDAASYTNFKNLYVNASICPRFSTTDEGAFAVKLSRVLASQDRNRVIVVSGSSSYLGLGTEYLEALLDNQYRVVNFGTTRTTHGTIYLEAMQKYAHEGDIVIYAPENSAYMYGETELYWKTIRDLEGMYNLFRYVDMSNYTAVFSSFAELNSAYKYKRTPTPYELICTAKYTNKFGDRKEEDMAKYVDLSEYSDSYYITFTNRIKSKYDVGNWRDEDSELNGKDYNDPNNKAWCSIDQQYMLDLMNHAIDAARSSGAKVYYGFAPTDADSVAVEQRSIAALNAYDELISRIYHFDGNLGSSKNYIFARKYFHDCAFHPNDYGKTYRTYAMYLDLAAIIGISEPHEIFDKGVNFAGCLFEYESEGAPLTEVPYLKEQN